MPSSCPLGPRGSFRHVVRHKYALLCSMPRMATISSQSARKYEAQNQRVEAVASCNRCMENARARAWICPESGRICLCLSCRLTFPTHTIKGRPGIYHGRCNTRRQSATRAPVELSQLYIEPYLYTLTISPLSSKYNIYVLPSVEVFLIIS